MTLKMATSFSEPFPRFGHLSAPVDGKLCVWGGHTNSFFQDKDKLVSSVHSFDPLSESWAKIGCSGLPDGRHGIFDCASTSIGQYLYLYGGNDGSRWHSSLNRLDTKSGKWNQLSSAGPMEKVDCAMVASSNIVVLFGGYGFLSQPTQPGAKFIRSGSYTDNRGWTNELHTFDLEKGTVSHNTQLQC